MRTWGSQFIPFPPAIVQKWNLWSSPVRCPAYLQPRVGPASCIPGVCLVFRQHWCLPGMEYLPFHAGGKWSRGSFGRQGKLRPHGPRKAKPWTPESSFPVRESTCWPGLASCPQLPGALTVTGIQESGGKGV